MGVTRTADAVGRGGLRRVRSRSVLVIDKRQRTLEQVLARRVELVLALLLGLSRTRPGQRALDHDAELEASQHSVPGDMRKVARGIGGVPLEKVVGAGQP